MTILAQRRISHIDSKGPRLYPTFSTLMIFLLPSCRWTLLRCPCGNVLSTRKTSLYLTPCSFPSFASARQRHNIVNVAFLRQIAKYLFSKMIYASVNPLYLGFLAFRQIHRPLNFHEFNDSKWTTEGNNRKCIRICNIQPVSRIHSVRISPFNTKNESWSERNSLAFKRAPPVPRVRLSSNE